MQIISLAITVFLNLGDFLDVSQTVGGRRRDLFLGRCRCFVIPSGRSYERPFGHCARHKWLAKNDFVDVANVSLFNLVNLIQTAVPRSHRNRCLDGLLLGVRCIHDRFDWQGWYHAAIRSCLCLEGAIEVVDIVVAWAKFLFRRAVQLDREGGIQFPLCCAQLVGCVVDDDRGIQHLAPVYGFTSLEIKSAIQVSIGSLIQLGGWPQRRWRRAVFTRSSKGPCIDNLRLIIYRVCNK